MQRAHIQTNHTQRTMRKRNPKYAKMGNPWNSAPKKVSSTLFLLLLFPLLDEEEDSVVLIESNDREDGEDLGDWMWCIVRRIVSSESMSSNEQTDDSLPFRIENCHRFMINVIFSDVVCGRSGRGNGKTNGMIKRQPLKGQNYGNSINSIRECSANVLGNS